jgi:hypothetical protein
MTSPHPSKQFELPALLAFATLLLPSLASAQGCSLCVTQAAQAGSRFIQALRSGILVLIFPPMAVCIAITYAAWRKRNSFVSDNRLC